MSDESTPAAVPASAPPVLDLEGIRRAITSPRNKGARFVSIAEALLAEVERLLALHASTEGALDVYPAVEDALAKHTRGWMSKPTTRENIAELVDRICQHDSDKQQRIQQLEGTLRADIDLLQDTVVQLTKDHPVQLRDALAREQKLAGALRQVVERWRGMAVQQDGNMTCVNHAFYICADELTALLALPLGGERKT